MRQKTQKRIYHITLMYENNITRTIVVRAASREVAEKRALKRNPRAIGIKREA